MPMSAVSSLQVPIVATVDSGDLKVKPLSRNMRGQMLRLMGLLALCMYLPALALLWWTAGGAGWEDELLIAALITLTAVVAGIAAWLAVAGMGRATVEDYAAISVAALEPGMIIRVGFRTAGIVEGVDAISDRVRVRFTNGDMSEWSIFGYTRPLRLVSPAVRVRQSA